MADELVRSTGYWSDAVPYKELEGSGDRNYSANDSAGNTVARKFLVLWDDADDFANGLIGGTSQVGASLQVRTPPKKDPNREFLVCQKVKVAGNANAGDNGNGVIQYKYADVEAEFATPSTPQGQDENQESVTYLTESWDVQKNLYPRKGWFYYWESGSQVDKAVGEDALLTVEVPEIRISIDVHKWYNPPLSDMVMAINRVNDASFRLTFCDWPAETLRFTNVKPSYELTQAGMTPWKVGLEYVFNPNGWNKLFCPQDGAFVYVSTTTSQRPFATYDFTRLLPAGIV